MGEIRTNHKTATQPGSSMPLRTRIATAIQTTGNNVLLKFAVFACSALIDRGRSSWRFGVALRQ